MKTVTPAERLMLRAWLDEIGQLKSEAGDGTMFRAEQAARRTGTTAGRILGLVGRVPSDVREACR